MNLAAGANGMGMKAGIELAVAAVVDELKKMATPVSDREQIARVAALSAHEEAIAQLLADAMDKVGREGVITVEESKSLTDELEFVEGVRVDRGYLSPHFVTDADRMEVALDEPRFLLTDQKISTPNDLIPIMEKIINSEKRPLVIIAEDVDGEALANLVVNKMRGTLACVAVKAPGFGERRKALLEDVAILTGATVISSDTGLKLDGAELSHLGTARRIVVSKDESTIIEGRGSAQAVTDRAGQLKVQIEETTSDYDREKTSRADGRPGRRRCRAESRRGYRAGGKRAEIPHGRRAGCHPRRGGRRNRPRRRRGHRAVGTRAGKAGNRAFR